MPVQRAQSLVLRLEGKKLLPVFQFQTGLLHQEKRYFGVGRCFVGRHHCPFECGFDESVVQLYRPPAQGIVDLLCPVFKESDFADKVWSVTVDKLPNVYRVLPSTAISIRPSSYSLTTLFTIAAASGRIDLIVLDEVDSEFRVILSAFMDESLVPFFKNMQRQERSGKKDDLEREQRKISNPT